MQASAGQNQTDFKDDDLSASSMTDWALTSILIASDAMVAHATGHEIYERFCAQPDLPAVAIIDENTKPIGIVRRTDFFIQFGQRWGRALFERRPITYLMDKEPLCVPIKADIAEAARLVSDSSGDVGVKGFIIVDANGSYIGIGDGAGLLRCLLNEHERDTQRLTIFNQQLERLLMLTAQPDVPLERVCREAARIVAESLGVSQAGVWLYEPDRNQIQSLSTYCAMSQKFTVQGALPLAAFPNYARALRQLRVIDASCAMQDPRTRELAESYLTPLNVHSMLDAQIRAGEHVSGVLCCESIGAERLWRADEIAFAASAASVIGQAILAHELRGERWRLEQRVLERTEELNAARDAAEAANIAKSQFLATMSHELRTPLNAIVGYSEIMREDAVVAHRATDMADHDRVLAAANRLLHLINGVLDLSKIEARRMDIEVRDIDVAQLAQEAIDAVRPQAEANGNIVALELPACIPAARTDGFKLGQCLLNLLSNAAKFTKGGKITLRVHHQAEWLMFDVIDTGIGIASDKTEALFEPFVQADASTTRLFGGTGLGLAITRGMAQLLGGDITVTSAVGKGSTFRLHIAACELPARSIA